MSTDAFMIILPGRGLGIQDTGGRFIDRPAYPWSHMDERGDILADRSTHTSQLMRTS
jgi:hypothetical protein